MDPDQAHHSLKSLTGLKPKHEEYNSHAGLSWIFHFVDIIYVGAISSIGKLFEECGTDYQVFLLAASYMGIMFTTRYQFDQYASTFNTQKTENNKEFVRIILMILYCMAIFSMSLNIAYKEAEEDGGGSMKNHFGKCFRSTVYDNGFAASFLISRAAIMFLYFVKYTHRNYIHNVDYKRLFTRKLVPMIVACALMTMTFADITPVKVYTIVAMVEFVGEFVGEWAIKLNDTDIMPDPEHLQERLGLFFMLILGETMVGTLRVFYDPSKPRRTYGTCLASFILVAAVGMQFFERAQSEVDSPSNFYGDVYKEEEDVTRLSSYFRESEFAPPRIPSVTSSALHSSTTNSAQMLASAGTMASLQMEGQHRESRDHFDNFSTDQGDDANKWNHHPLVHKKNKLYYALYVALHAIASFFMLIATTAVVEIYYYIENFPVAVRDDDAATDSYILSKHQVISGMIGVWACLMLMELLQPECYNSLVANWRTSSIVDQQYSKFQFGVKVLVIFSHIVLLKTTDDPHKGNYFVTFNAMVASAPSFFDICKIVYDYLGDVTNKRKEAARMAYLRKKAQEAVERAENYPSGPK